MDHKSSVLKSKSSNSALTTKSDRSNKKTTSNAGFQPITLKKRGVYVEKKNTSLNLNSFDTKVPVKQGLKSTIRPPLRPRRGQKKFLTSVLTILSKNTASTQYPDAPFNPDTLVNAEKGKNIRVKRMRRLGVKTAEKETQDTLVKKQTKYRSRVLNNMIRKDSKKVVIIQNRKEITHTPSNYSNKSYKELNDAIYKSLPPLFNDCDDNYSNTMKNLVARSKAAEQVQAELNDPITLVSETPQKDEKELYNFFVDLLETTFSVYNVKTKFNQVTPSEFGSKLAFEIDENVANKLCVSKNQNNDRNEEETPIANPSCCINKRYCVNDNMQLHICKSPAISSKPDSNRRQYKTKLKSESYFYQNPKFKIISPLQSVIMNKKRSSHKRNRKQTLLNMLKEELRMDDCSFEEPQNMHQALKIIARNNRRIKKAIHFADDVTRTDDDDQRKQECMFKRRKVISSSTKSTKKNYKFSKTEKNIYKTFRTDTIAQKFSDPNFFSKNLPKSGYSTEDDKTNSYHSLEVHSYDFEATPTKRYYKNKNKNIVYTKKSSISIKDEFSPKASLLKFSTSFNSSKENIGSDNLPSLE